jgi:serine/threonine-protein kinase
MATVYLAEDVKHRRKVAIKVLHPELSAVLGPDRFLKEIELTANLQHPNILPLFDSGAADGLLYYVMPFVEGESLRTRLTREKQLPVSDAVRIASEVAAALDYAHRRGVVHRDIKPENILLHDGRPMVADFGIALAVAQAGGSRMTQTGMSLGTPAYMSPEQAMGEREITARSDLYALGSVTYEMLTGEPPFTGPTSQAIVARIMTEEPRPITPQRNTVPPEVEDAVLSALAKLPADRFGTAAEFAEALTGARAQRRMGPRTTSLPGAGAPSRSTALIGALVVATALAVWGWLGRPRNAPPPVTRLRIAMTPGQELSSAFFQRFALSDDGRRMVYVGQAPNGQFQLWLRDLDAIDARPVAGTLGGYAPSFSPDGQSLVFVVNGKLFKAPLGGGEVTALADSVNNIAPGATWLADGTIVFGDENFRIRTLRPGASTPGIVPLEVGDTLGYLFPRSLPRSDAVLVVRCNDVCNLMELGTVSLSTGEYRKIADQTANGWYSPTGHIVGVRRTGAVVAIPFDLDRLEVRGEPIPLFDGVSVALGVVPLMWVSASGTLLYERSGLAFGRTSTVVRVGRDGSATAVDPAWPAAEFGLPAISPDGKRLALAMLSGQRNQVWIKQLDRGTLTRLTADGGLNFAPQWRPGGEEVAYVATEGGWHVSVRRPDGTGTVTRVALPTATVVGGPNWTPDGKWLVIRISGPGGHDIYRTGVGTDSIAPVLASRQFDELNPAVAPNGQWFAYQSNESGRMEIYLRPFPDAQRERIPVSRSGGITPGWSRDGRELFFVSDGQLLSVPVTWSSRPALGEPRALFALRDFVIDELQPSFEPEPGGKTFLMLKQADLPATQLVLVLNWLEELRTKTSAAR